MDRPLHAAREHVFLREREYTAHTRGERGGQQRTQYNRTDWEGRHGNRSLGLHLFIILYVVRVGQANNECILEKSSILLMTLDNELFLAIKLE